MKEDLDVLVIGSGIAGLSAALALAGRLDVAVVSKEPDGGGSTVLAQGGIAAALGPEDSSSYHAADTLAAAAGLGDPYVAEAVTSEAVDAVSMLSTLGARFDAGAMAKEGGHSRARVVHARGDATGAEISHALVAAALSRGVALISGMFLVDLVGEAGTAVWGATLYDTASGQIVQVNARNVVLATGGYGQLWASTTSPRACSGDGLSAALRAGAQAADLEFVQFHPTGMALGRDPRPLASEALRGEGARLRDAAGAYLHADTADGVGDLAPRDVVSRSMAASMSELGVDHCWLDATAIGREALEKHFPTFVAACRAAGVHPERQWVPVSPTAHYTMGGLLTDLDGRTTLEGLLAVGEVGCSGLHGANRLASNSLLEGAVIGRRAAAAVLAGGGEPVSPRSRVVLTEPLFAMGAPSGTALERQQLRDAMQAYAGVSRDGDGLAVLTDLLAGGSSMVARTPAELELANMALVAQGAAAMAARRLESRGAHWRTDYPMPRPEWQLRQVAQLLPNGEMAVGELPASGASALDAVASSPALATALR